LNQRPNEFKRESRLLNAGDFRFVFDDAKRSSSRFLTVLARPNGESQARLGLIVSKKSVKLAVGRNRVKRLTRESFRINSELLQGLDVIVLSKRGINEKNNSEIFSDLMRHWKKLGQCKR